MKLTTTKTIVYILIAAAIIIGGLMLRSSINESTDYHNQDFNSSR